MSHEARHLIRLLRWCWAPRVLPGTQEARSQLRRVTALGPGKLPDTFSLFFSKIDFRRPVLMSLPFKT